MSESDAQKSFVLLDESGNEITFEVVGECVYKKKTYYAIVNPAECEEGAFENYLIIREDKVGNEISFDFIEDDEEFDDVADLFDDMFTAEIDCDNL